MLDAVLYTREEARVAVQLVVQAQHTRGVLRPAGRQRGLQLAVVGGGQSPIRHVAIEQFGGTQRSSVEWERAQRLRERGALHMGDA